MRIVTGGKTRRNAAARKLVTPVTPQLRVNVLRIPAVTLIFAAFSYRQFPGTPEAFQMRDKLNELEQAQQGLSASAPYSVSQRYTLSHHMVTTAFSLDGFRIVRTLGVVRGITVRSRSIVGTVGGMLNTIVGGNITAFTKLCEVARAEAFEIMVQHASEIGANAVIGMRYDANEIMNGVTEVLAYGTAVVVEPIE